MASVRLDVAECVAVVTMDIPPDERRPLAMDRCEQGNIAKLASPHDAAFAKRAPVLRGR